MTSSQNVGAEAAEADAGGKTVMAKREIRRKSQHLKQVIQVIRLTRQARLLLVRLRMARLQQAMRQHLMITQKSLPKRHGLVVVAVLQEGLMIQQL
jgi:hypothetical protein